MNGADKAAVAMFVVIAITMLTFAAFMIWVMVTGASL